MSGPAGRDYFLIWVEVQAGSITLPRISSHSACNTLPAHSQENISLPPSAYCQLITALSPRKFTSNQTYVFVFKVVLHILLAISSFSRIEPAMKYEVAESQTLTFQFTSFKLETSQQKLAKLIHIPHAIHCIARSRLFLTQLPARLVKRVSWSKWLRLGERAEGRSARQSYARRERDKFIQVS